MRQARLPHLGTRAFEPSGHPLDDLAHAWLYPLPHQLGHHPDPQALHAVVQVREVVGDFDVGARRVARVVAGDGLQQERRVPHVAGHRADDVERGSEGDQAIARDPPVGWFEPDDATERRRLAYGAAGVRPERPPALARRDRSSRSARGSTRNAAQVPGVATGTPGRILRR
jgi:hypothetical protein